MTDMSFLSTILLFLCGLIALFYFFRLMWGHRWTSHVDAENEIGHGVMAVGMMFMLLPAGSIPSGLLEGNIFFFAAACLWWTCRLLLRKPLLAFLPGYKGAPTTVQADGIHVFMHSGMCLMFLLMMSMTFSMTPLALTLTCFFFASFAFLTVFYGRESGKDLLAEKKDWLQCGANLAHLFMSGVMCWMFLGMITMTMSMKG